MSDNVTKPPAHEYRANHANRLPKSLTEAERAWADERAKTLYPGQRLTASGDSVDEHHIRTAIAEAEILDNPSLHPLESPGEVVEVGRGFAAQPGNSLALDLAEVVLAYRARHGLSQQQLAERLGVRQPHVARLEAAVHTPSVETLVRVARALGMPLHVDIAPAGARLAHEDPREEPAA